MSEVVDKPARLICGLSLIVSAAAVALSLSAQQVREQSREVVTDNLVVNDLCWFGTKQVPCGTLHRAGDYIRKLERDYPKPSDQAFHCDPIAAWPLDCPAGPSL